MSGPAPNPEPALDRLGGAHVEDLVRRARAGSSQAFGELVDRFASPLYNFLLRRAASPEDAEEIAQDAFVRAWKRIGLYDERWSFSTWLFTLARRLAATRARPGAIRFQGSQILDDVRVHADPGRDLAREEERMNLWAIADRVLDEDPRSALWLRYAEDLEIPEIAEILGRSSVSVRVMLFRARARLGEHLAPVRSDVRGSVPSAEPVSASRVSARKAGP